MKLSKASIGGLVKPWNGKTQKDAPYQELITFLGVRTLYYLQHQEERTDLLIMLDEETGNLLQIPGGYGSENGTKKIARLVDQKMRELPEAPAIQGPLALNLEWLGERLKLNDTEKGILALAALIQKDSILNSFYSYLDDLRLPRLENLLAFLLSKPRTLIHEAIGPKGMLQQSRLITLGEDYALQMREPMANLLLKRYPNPNELFGQFYGKSQPATLQLKDFGHLKSELPLLRKLVKRAVQTERQGINILLYGAPGTGKTELARALAADLGFCLYDVKIMDEEDNPLSGPDRFGAYALMQKTIARQGNTLIIFDEVEDVFPSPSFWSFLEGKRQTQHKAWTNRLLEENPVPSIWIANAIDGIDPAYRRRFTWEMEMGTPPKPVRQRILAHHLDKLPVSEEWIAQTAKDGNLLPGHVERAVKVLQLVQTKNPKENEKILEQMLRNGRNGGKAKEGLPEGYDLSYVNADQDLHSLAEGIQKHGEARLLFYGAPGTGKTAFVQYLSEHLEKPLRSYTASDLLGPFVGQTEDNIARLFEEASDESIVFLDEADSFLQIRAQADRHWEITQVNELLQRMERFQGILICATNRKEGMDPAVMRRFDLQVEFLPMNYQQRLDIIHSALERMGLQPKTKEEETFLQKVVLTKEGITPGEVGKLLRHNRFHPCQTFEEAMTRIENITGQIHQFSKNFGFSGIR